MSVEHQKQAKISKVKSWIERFVIGLNLCPFAAKPFQKDKIKYVVNEEDNWKMLQAHFWDEIEMLDLESHSTTLIIYPLQFSDFLMYLDFYNQCEKLIEKYNKTLDYQLASFHPQYQFADAEYSDVSNYTNRSPYPIIQILRCEEVEQAVAVYGDTERIYEQNVALMERMGLGKVRQILNRD